ncbi:MAG: hypothetical protein ACFCVE_14980 [Phycisphaerae bacterium]
MRPIPEQLLNHLPPALRRDPKKTGVLAGLVLVLVVLWVVMFGRGEEGGGVAATIARVASSVTSTEAEEVKLTPASPQLLAWLSRPTPVTPRDVFAVDWEAFPIEPGKEAAPVEKVEPGEIFWSKLEKSLARRADALREKAVARASLKEAADDLRLTSTLMGRNPAAVIDGKLVRVGDVLASFRVLAIEPRRVVLEREGVRFEVEMAGESFSSLDGN